jgi:hypothetical protein
MAAPDAVDFLIKDHGDVNPPGGFRADFAEDVPYKSLLQRQGIELEDLLDKFDWKDDDDEWMSEYTSEKPDLEKMIRYRRRVAFCVCGWRELKEDFGRGDVSCLRDIRVPLVTSRSPLKAAKDEFNDE